MPGPCRGPLIRAFGARGRGGVGKGIPKAHKRVVHQDARKNKMWQSGFRNPPVMGRGEEVRVLGGDSSDDESCPDNLRLINFIKENEVALDIIIVQFLSSLI